MGLGCGRTFHKAMSTGKFVVTLTLDGLGPVNLVLSRHESMKALFGQFL